LKFEWLAQGIVDRCQCLCKGI